MKRYEGKRLQNQPEVTVDGMPLDPRPDLCSSPVGFEWGYNGSGPKQLAIAILADFLHDENEALALCQSFRESIISKLPRENWTLTSEQIEHALQALCTTCC